MFTWFLAYAAWQDGRRGCISTITVAAVVATSLDSGTTPTAALAPVLTGVPWIWLHYSGALGPADPPAAVAIVFRHGTVAGLLALGIACLTTAAAVVCCRSHPPAQRYPEVWLYPTVARHPGEPHRPGLPRYPGVPLYPGLLIAHLVVGTAWL
ncbi:MAG: hypothetical protein R6U25_12170 [Alkalispirochaeta sp.]